MKSRLAFSLVVMIAFSGLTVAVAQDGAKSGPAKDERSAKTAAPPDGPIVLVEMPDRGRQAWAVIPTPFGPFNLPDHVVLGPDGTTIARFSDVATAINITGQARRLEAFIRAGGGDPIPSKGIVGAEVEDPLPDTPSCVNEERCWSKICFPSCEEGGEFWTCGGSCSNCTYLKICG